MKAKWIIAVLFVVLVGTGAWAQEGLRGDRGHDRGDRNTGQAEWNDNVWQYNMKQLVESAFGRHERLNNLAELALQNAVTNSNQQNVNAINWSNAVAGIGRETTVFQAATAAAGQGRQLTTADTSQNRQATSADVAMGQAYQNATFMNQLAAMIEAKLAEAVVPIITEALRNPPAGMSSTGRPPVNQDGQ